MEQSNQQINPQQNQQIPPPSNHQTPPSASPQINLHKQKSYSLLGAGVAFVGMILSWWTTPGIAGFGGGASGNGFNGWGLLSLFGIVAVVVASLMGNHVKEYDNNLKMLAIAGFGGTFLGAFIVFMNITGAQGISTGIGIWFTMVAGILGILWVSGIIKLQPSQPPPPPPPPYNQNIPPFNATNQNINK